MTKQQQVALAVIEGALDEKLRAFSAIGAAAQSGLFPAGYNTVQQVTAACWMADALQVHPIALMNGCHVMAIRGRNVIEPKWEFVHALLKSRLPGFKFKVVEETPESCTLWGTDGVDEHTVTYAMADATRQGLTTNALYRTSSKEMLFKQAYKRLADRVGAHVLAGLPAFEPWEEPDEPEARPASTAELDPSQEIAAAARVEQESSPVQFPPAVSAPAVLITPPAAGDASPSIHAQLADALVGMYGKLKKSDLPIKAALVIKQMSGVAIAIKSLAEIEPATAKAMVEWIAKRNTVAGVAATSSAASTDAPPADEERLPFDDDVPPVVDDDAPAVTVPWNEFQALALRFEKEVGSPLIAPGRKLDGTPVPSKTFVIDRTVYEACGYEAPVLIFKNDWYALPQHEIVAIVQQARAVMLEASKPGWVPR